MVSLWHIAALALAGGFVAGAATAFLLASAAWERLAERERVAARVRALARAVAEGRIVFHGADGRPARVWRVAEEQADDTSAIRTGGAR